MSSSASTAAAADAETRWLPTHVQVTVLRARGLRAKGKQGTSDAYAIIQLAKEKYSTRVADKSTAPEWREECTFELQAGALEGSGGGGGCSDLVLTVMHRALIGLDVFLGQAVIRLEHVYYCEGRSVKNEWYRLNSKTGKKEKERGEIQVSVQFTRNNLTASMYELVMQDKGPFGFSKLRERMKLQRRRPASADHQDEIGVDLVAAPQPGGYGSLCRMRQRLPSDGGGEEDYEDDEGGEVRRSKMRSFFLRGKLRKSSDTRSSSTSLGSESSESSSRGGSLSPTAGISVVVSDLSNSPSNSSNLTADGSPEHSANMSPKSSSSLQCEFGDDVGEISIVVPQLFNGGHAPTVPLPDPGSGKPALSLVPGLKQKPLTMSASLQNLSLRGPTQLLATAATTDGRRWSFDEPCEKEKAAIVAALERSGPLGVQEGKEKGMAENLVLSERSLESGGRSHSQEVKETGVAGVEERHRGWFGSKDSHSKPSRLPPHKVEPCPAHPPVGHTSVSYPSPPLHHTNPFAHSQRKPPPCPVSPCNPFLSLLLLNPFYDDMLSARHRMHPPCLPVNGGLSDSFQELAIDRLQAAQAPPTDTALPPQTYQQVTVADDSSSQAEVFSLGTPARESDPAAEWLAGISPTHCMANSANQEAPLYSGSSGLGSLAEDDFLSCPSSCLDKDSTLFSSVTSPCSTSSYSIFSSSSPPSPCPQKMPSDGALIHRPHLLHFCQSDGATAAISELPCIAPSHHFAPAALHLSLTPPLPAALAAPAAPAPSAAPLPPATLCPLPSSARSSLCTAPSQKPQEQQLQQQQQQQAANQQNSPHPVKPLTAAVLAEEKRGEGRGVLASGLEKLRSTISPARCSPEQEGRKKTAMEGAGSYYHLSHSELVALLVRQETELERQRVMSEQQQRLLAKRELELRRLKPQVRDLEDYIDTLLVRIMEQKPTLLQVRTKLK